MNLRPQSFRIIVQLSTHVPELLHDKTGMMKERRSRRRQLDASPLSHQERRAKIDFHVADSPAGGSRESCWREGPPRVMFEASATWRNKRRSVRSNRSAIGWEPSA